MNITINQEYAELVPEISVEEYEALKQSVKENGLYVPIIVDQNGVLLDGHHRYKVCLELGIEPSYLIKEFADELDGKLFVIDCNLTRRQLNNFQRTELALKSKPILEAIAKRNESLGGKGDRNLTPLGRVDETIGERAGVSRDTVRKVERIIEFFSEGQDINEEVLEKLRSGKISVNEAYQQIPIQEPIPSGTKGPLESCPMNSRAVEEEPLTQQEQEQAADHESKEYPKSPISVEQELKHDDAVDDQYHHVRSLIELLAGIDYIKERKSNLELVDKTKEHRFRIIKRLSDLDVKAIYTDCRTLAHILNDYLKQLDDELDVRQAKEKLVSE
jgi:ParB-like chromosome segregation protein Spo0J